MLALFLLSIVLIVIAGLIAVNRGNPDGRKTAMEFVCILIELRSNGDLGKVAPYETREEAEAQRSVLELQFPHSKFLLRDCDIIGGNKRR